VAGAAGVDRHQVSSGVKRGASKVHHNTLLEVAWTLIPVIILVFIAVPSSGCSISSGDPKARHDDQGESASVVLGPNELSPAPPRGFTYDSLGPSDADASKAGKPRLAGRGHPILVPVNKVVDNRYPWAPPT